MMGSESGKGTRGKSGHMMGGVSANGTRRCSATAISHRPPIPPAISTRSHSLDELLDCKDDNDVDDEGVSEKENQIIDNQQSPASSIKSNNRLSKSMELLLDNDEDDCPPPDQKSKSTETLDKDSTSNSFLSLPRTATPSEKCCENEIMTVNDTAYNSDEEGDRESSATMSRQNSTSSEFQNGDRKKTFINRIGKRMKSLIKK